MKRGERIYFYIGNRRLNSYRSGVMVTCYTPILCFVQTAWHRVATFLNCQESLIRINDLVLGSGPLLAIHHNHPTLSTSHCLLTASGSNLPSSLRFSHNGKYLEVGSWRNENMNFLDLYRSSQSSQFFSVSKNRVLNIISLIHIFFPLEDQFYQLPPDGHHL